MTAEIFQDLGRAPVIKEFVSSRASSGDTNSLINGWGGADGGTGWRRTADGSGHIGVKWG